MGRRPVYDVWRTAKARCHNPLAENYKRYGGRGIVMCEEWINDFARFAEDMGPRPVGAQLDRIDNNGPYAKWNCRWATREEQSSNRRDNRYLTFNGVTLTLAAWGRQVGMTAEAISYRLRKGWSLERALTVPSIPLADRRWGRCPEITGTPTPCVDHTNGTFRPLSQKEQS